MDGPSAIPYGLLQGPMMPIPTWFPKESLVCSHRFSDEVRAYLLAEWRTEPLWVHDPARWSAPRPRPSLAGRLRSWLASVWPARSLAPGLLGPHLDPPAEEPCGGCGEGA